MPIDAPRLAALISPISVEDFIDRYWDRNALHLRRDDPACYREILDVDNLARAFASESLHPSFFRVVNGGVDRAASEWTRIEQRRNTEPYRVVQTHRLLDLLSAGDTVVVNAIDRALPSVAAWCRALEHELSSRVQGNVYITPPGAQGFSTHADDHDAFVLQLFGAKSWRLIDSGERTIEMRTGDLLYLPAHVRHDAATSSFASIHLTVGVQSPRWHHLVAQLARAAEGSPDFRPSLLPALLSRERANDAREAFFAALGRLAGEARWDELLDAERRRGDRDDPADPGGRFLDIVNANRLTTASVVAKRPDAAWQLERRNGHLIVESRGRSLELPRFLEGAVMTLLGDRPVTLRDVQGLLADDGKVSLARDLVRLGVLRIEAL